MPTEYSVIRGFGGGTRDLFKHFSDNSNGTQI